VQVITEVVAEVPVLIEQAGLGHVRVEAASKVVLLIATWKLAFVLRIKKQSDLIVVHRPTVCARIAIPLAAPLATTGIVAVTLWKAQRSTCYT
jgi:hypothetical protein